MAKSLAGGCREQALGPVTSAPAAFRRDDLPVRLSVHERGESLMLWQTRISFYGRVPLPPTFFLLSLSPGSPVLRFVRSVFFVSRSVVGAAF